MDYTKAFGKGLVLEDLAHNTIVGGVEHIVTTHETVYFPNGFALIEDIGCISLIKLSDVKYDEEDNSYDVTPLKVIVKEEDWLPKNEMDNRCKVSRAIKMEFAKYWEQN